MGLSALLACLPAYKGMCVWDSWRDTRGKEREERAASGWSQRTAQGVSQTLPNPLSLDYTQGKAKSQGNRDSQVLTPWGGE